jgi:hypothetical protein
MVDKLHRKRPLGKPRRRMKNLRIILKYVRDTGSCPMTDFGVSGFKSFAYTTGEIF